MLKSKLGVILFSLLFLVIILGISWFVFGDSILRRMQSEPESIVNQEELEREAAKFLPAEDQILVKFKPGLDAAKQQEFLTKYNAKIISEMPEIGSVLLSVDSSNTEQLSNEIRQEDSDTLDYVEPNFKASINAVPNDTYYGAQQSAWYNSAAAPGGWDLLKGDNTIIAVIDTGIDTVHPDLKDKIVAGKDFVNNDNDPTDDNGHGTATAGTAAAITNNALGVAGSSWNSKILPLKAMDASGSGYYSQIASAIIYAADSGAQVISMSLGGTATSSTLSNAIDYAIGKNAVIVASAGNSNTAVMYPAAYPSVISVGALNGDFTTKTSYSCYGENLDVMAYGTAYTTNRGGGYGGWAGTSFSAPYVSGLAALIKSHNSSLTPQQINDYLIQNTADLGAAGWDQNTGWGRIDYTKTLTTVVSNVPPTPMQGIVAGKITDLSSGAPIFSALIKATQSGVTKGQTSSLADGSYMLSLNPGTYDIEVSAANYTSQKKTDIAISSGLTTSLNIALAPKIIDLMPPTVTITSPTNGASFVIGRQQVTISANGTDNIGVVKLEFYIDGVRKATKRASSGSYNWSIRREAAGSHVITVKAYDAAGNIGQAQISVMLTK